jgi:hypothetical protein
VVQDLVANVVRECVEPFLVGKSKVFVTGDAFLALERERKKRILEKVEVLQVRSPFYFFLLASAGSLFLSLFPASGALL